MPKFDDMNRMIQQRDEKLIKKYCSEGTYITDGGVITGGVCKSVPFEELLNDLHLHDAHMAELIKKDGEEE